MAYFYENFSFTKVAEINHIWKLIAYNNILFIKLPNNFNFFDLLIWTAVALWGVINKFKNFCSSFFVFLYIRMIVR